MKFIPSSLFWAALFGAAWLPLSAAAAPPSASGDTLGWTEVLNKPGFALFSRSKKDSSVLEYKAVGDIAVSPWVLKNVIDDLDAYPAFMPYVSESRTLARESGGRIVTYQRLNTPFVKDRDYILCIQCESSPAPGGKTAYRNRWEAVTGYGMEERKGVIRVKINSGSWLLEPSDGGTRATYQIYTDPGGALPAMAVNYANKNAIPKLFVAIEKQAAEKKYRTKKPSVP